MLDASQLMVDTQGGWANNTITLKIPPKKNYNSIHHHIQHPSAMLTAILQAPALLISLSSCPAVEQQAAQSFVICDRQQITPMFYVAIVKAVHTQSTSRHDDNMPCCTLHE